MHARAAARYSVLLFRLWGEMREHLLHSLVEILRVLIALWKVCRSTPLARVNFLLLASNRSTTREPTW